jgi:transcriptional regulator
MSRYSVKNSHTSPTKIAFQRRMAEARCYREQGLTHEEIGERLKTHPGNANKLVTKAMDRIIMEPAKRVLDLRVAAA